MEREDQNFDHELRAAARDLGRRLGLADDLEQDARLAALTRHTRPRNPRQWMLRVVRHRATDAARAASTRARRERVAARRETVDAPRDLDRTLVRSDVVAAIEALPPRYRTVVLLRYVEDLPPRVIAARLGLGVRTVDERLARARDLLRHRLSPGYANDRSWRSRAGGLLASLAAMKLKSLTIAVAAVVLVTWLVRYDPVASVADADVERTPPSTATIPDAADASRARPVVTDPFVVADDEGKTVTFLVTDADERPLEGAVVHGAPYADAAQTERERLRLSSEGRRIRTHRELGRTGPDGRLTIPEPRGLETFAARHAYGAGVRHPSLPPGLIVLYPRLPAIAIEVVDHGGRPAKAVPLIVRQDREVTWRGYTDDRGRAMTVDDLVDRGEVTVSAEIPGIDVDPIIVDRATSPDDPIRLRIPPTTAIELDVRDADGAPLDAAVRANCRSVSPATRDAFVPIADHLPGITRRVCRAPLSFAHLPPHALVRMEVLAFGPRRGSFVVVRTGAPGERKQVSLRLPGLVRVTFRALTHDERPIDRPIWVRCGGPEPSDWAEGHTTPLGDGYAAFDVPRSLDPRRPRRLRFGFDYPTEWMTVPSDVAAWDFGNVILTKPVARTTGRIVEHDGTPVANESFVVESVGQTRTFFAEFPKTDSEGRFDVTVPATCPYRIRITRHGREAHKVVELVGGHRDLEIVVDEGASLSGRILMPPCPGSDARVRFRIGDEDWWEYLDESGRFRLHGLPRKPGRLTVFSGQEIVQTLDGVRPTKHGEPDSRLAPLDLRASLRAISLEVVDAQSQPINDYGWVLVPGSGPPVRAEMDEAGVLGIRVTGRPGRVHVLQRNHEPVTVTLEDGHGVVRLKRARAWRLSIECNVPDGFRLQGRLRAGAPRLEALDDEFTWQPLDHFERGARLPRGRWQMDWRLDPVGPGKPIISEHSTPFDILPGPDVQIVRLAPDPAFLKRDR